MRDTLQVATRDGMQDVFWFPNEGDWYYRYQPYEEGVDMSRKFLLYYHGSPEYMELFSNLVDYKDEVK